MPLRGSRPGPSHSSCCGFTKRRAILPRERHTTIVQSSVLACIDDSLCEWRKPTTGAWRQAPASDQSLVTRSSTVCSPRGPSWVRRGALKQRRCSASHHPRTAGSSSAQGSACCLGVCWVPALCPSACLSSACISPSSRGGLVFFWGGPTAVSGVTLDPSYSSVRVRSHWLDGGGCGRRSLMQVSVCVSSLGRPANPGLPTWQEPRKRRTGGCC